MSGAEYYKKEISSAATLRDRNKIIKLNMGERFEVGTFGVIRYAASVGSANYGILAL